MTGPRLLLAAGSLGCVIVVNAVALALGPANARPIFACCAVLALAAAVFGLLARDDRFGLTLLASAPPVLGLLATDRTWLLGPLGVLLFVAAELGAWSWEQRGAGTDPAPPARRVLRSAALGGIGLVVSLLCYAVGAVHPLAGTAAVFAAALGTAAVAWVLARAATRR
ncbi:hypothetical protein Athai_39350 [Actinocatenispora thailandica]|uniref:Uncharacterized protein n=1 Tax=Actinocatenispora thailandica TaxID=227318 RepID=A0A7R7DRG8_9ACTN|nr:hypothetical protein [Actinocatenispora thailandica]BCJ36432.1 hypothetical protein Athai_39350 [Actinocatenispora thailandica]